MKKGKTDDYRFRHQNGKEACTQKESCEILKEHYKNLYKPRDPEAQEHRDFITEANQTRNDLLNANRNNTTPFTMSELVKAIKSMKGNKAPGTDKISTEAIKTLLHHGDLSETLTLYNELYTKNIVPNEWKKGLLTSIWKGKGVKGDPNNERGITLSNTPLKVMEKLLLTRIMRDTRISPRQIGGMPGKGTVDHIFTLNSIIYQTLKNKEYMNLTFLDIEKAFDKASFSAITRTLKDRGAKTDTLQYICNLNKDFHVKINTRHNDGRNQTNTDNLINTSNVLKQGSVLSPIEFGALIDDICETAINKTKHGTIEDRVVVNGKEEPMVLFVDDITIATRNRTLTNEYLKNTVDEAKKRLLKFGVPKCKTMEYNKQAKTHEDACIVMDGEELEFVTEFKYLGLIFNDKGDLENHLNEIEKKANKTAWAIKTLIHTNELYANSTKMAKMFTQTLLTPIMTYGLNATIPKPKEWQRITRIYNNCVKTIWGISNFQSGPTLLREMQLEPIKVTIEKQQLDYLTKICKGENESLKNAFKHFEGWQKHYDKLLKTWQISKSEMEQASLKEALRLINSKKQERSDREIINLTKHSNSYKHLTSLDAKCCDKIHNDYTQNTNITQAKNIFKARTNTVIHKNLGEIDCDTNTCTICEHGKNTLEHLLGNCWPLEYIANWIPIEAYHNCEHLQYCEYEQKSANITLLENCMESFKTTYKTVKNTKKPKEAKRSRKPP